MNSIISLTYAILSRKLTHTEPLLGISKTLTISLQNNTRFLRVAALVFLRWLPESVNEFLEHLLQWLPESVNEFLEHLVHETYTGKSVPRC